MAAEIEGFDWDAANVGHIMLHAVSPYEVEDAAGRPHVTIHGKTASQRYLVVVFTVRRKLLRTVTAYEMNAAERRKYGAQID